MLPASLIADCSISPRSLEEPCGRRSISSARRTAVGLGNTSSVRPVRSPSMCMSTAATGSSGAETCGGTSSSREMLIVGTLIMIVLLIIWESAVAACPAPRFATSRRASSCSAFNDRMSSMVFPLEKAAHIDDQRRGSVAENGGSAEQRKPVPHTVELLDDDLLLPDQRVHDQRGAALGDLDDHHLLAAARDLALEAHHLTHPHHREHFLAEHQHLLPLHRAKDGGHQLHRLAHVRHRHGVRLVADAREERAH